MKNGLDAMNERNSLRSSFDDFDDFFERAFRSPWISPWAATIRSGRTGQQDSFEARTDVEETESAYIVSVDLPGMRQEDVKVEVNDDVLTISGERKREGRSENGGSRRFERSYGQFQRSFSLPASIDAGKIEAQMEDGVLSIAIPKAEAAKPRTVAIQSGRGGFLSKLVGGDRKDSAEQRPAGRH